MKKTKYLSLIMILTLIITGCGTSSKTNDKETNNDNKPIAVNPPLDPGYTGVKKIVYLDPTNLNKKCTESDVKSDDEIKSGCMKWYAYKEDDNSYTMILDHNTTNLANWILEEDYLEAGGLKEDITTYPDGRTAPPTDKGALTAEKVLKEDTIYWDKSLNARLFTSEEFMEIVGNNGRRCLDSDSSKYGWLYDRTSKECKKFGCLNSATGNADGYWTSSYSDSSNIYYIGDGYEGDDHNYGGCLSNWGTVSDVKEGIRPVITVQKDSLTFVETNE